jgi:hypothetical protein
MVAKGNERESHSKKIPRGWHSECFRGENQTDAPAGSSDTSIRDVAAVSQPKRLKGWDASGDSAQKFHRKGREDRKELPMLIVRRGALDRNLSEPLFQAFRVSPSKMRSSFACFACSAVQLQCLGSGRQVLPGWGVRMSLTGSGPGAPPVPRIGCHPTP